MEVCTKFLYTGVLYVDTFANFGLFRYRYGGEGGALQIPHTERFFSKLWEASYTYFSLSATDTLGYFVKPPREGVSKAHKRSGLCSLIRTFCSFATDIGMLLKTPRGFAKICIEAAIQITRGYTGSASLCLPTSNPLGMGWYGGSQFKKNIFLGITWNVQMYASSCFPKPKTHRVGLGRRKSISQKMFSRN